MSVAPCTYIKVESAKVTRIKFRFTCLFIPIYIIIIISNIILFYVNVLIN